MRSLEVQIECEALPPSAVIYEYSGREAISRPFEFDLSVASAGTSLDPSALVGESATLSFWIDGEHVRSIHGVIAECLDLLQTEGEHALYQLRLVPRLWRSSLMHLIDIYLDQSVPDLIQHKLKLSAMERGTDFEVRLRDKYPVREFVVQYEESDLDFFSRLCEHLGISYFFEHKDGVDVVVFADGNHAFGLVSPDGSAPFYPRGERRGVFELRAATRMIPSQFFQRDFNYRTPTVDLFATATLPHGQLGAVYEYGGHFKTPEEGEKLALVRSEERLATKQIYEGRSVLPGFTAGAMFDLRDHPHGDLRLLITEVRHRGKQLRHGAGEGESFYENEFKAIRSDTVFRPPRATPKPHVKGLLTGIVEGPEDSEYADVDDQGRYRVRFLFDITSEGERQASRPIRMMQPHAGGGYGMHFPLRRGVEVLIAFVGGDPDRPIIAGTVPNPVTASPVATKNKERNVIRTGGGNEINIDDTSDSQRIKLSSPKSSSVLQLGAPNAWEDGVALQTTTNITGASSGTTNFLSSFSTNWSTWFNTWSNHVTTVAGKLTRYDVFNYTTAAINNILGQVGGGIDMVLTAIDTHNYLLLEKTKKAQKERDEALTSLRGDIDARLLDKDLPADAPERLALLEMRGAVKGYEDERAKLANAQDELAALQERRALADDEGRSPDDPDIVALDAQIADKEGEVEALGSSVNDARVSLDAAVETRNEGLLAEVTAKLLDPSLSAADRAKLEALKGKLEALATAKQCNDEAQAALATEQGKLATLEGEVADLEAQLEQKRLQNPNDPTLAADEQAIADKKKAIEDQQKVVDDKQKTADERAAAAKDAREQRDGALEDATGFAVDKKVLAYSKASEAYDDAVQEHEAFNNRHYKNGSPTHDAEQAKKWMEQASSIIDTGGTFLTSTLTALIGGGLQQYAGAVSNIMWEEANLQKKGEGQRLAVASKENKILGADVSHNAKSEAGDDRPNNDLGPLSRLKWGITDDPNKDPKTMVTEPLKNRMLAKGGGEGIFNSFEKGRTLLALGAAMFGPLAPFVLRIMNKSTAFNESRNIQGSEGKTVVFGKESVLVNGQEHTTVSSAGSVVVTANDRAVVHTRGRAEFLGVEEATLGSAKRVEVLSRDKIYLNAYERDPANASDMTKDKLRSRAFLQKGRFGVVAFNEANHNAERLSQLELNEQNVTIAARSGTNKTDASLELSAKTRQGEVSAKVVLEEAKKAAVLAGAWGLRADGTAEEATVGNGGWQVRAHSAGVQIGTDGNPEIDVQTNETSVTSDGTLNLGGNTIKVTATTLDLGACGIKSDNLVVKEEMNAAVQALTKKITLARNKATQAVVQAKQAQQQANLAKEQAAKARDEAQQAQEKAEDAKRAVTVK